MWRKYICVGQQANERSSLHLLPVRPDISHIYISVFLTLVCVSYYQLQTFEMATPRAPKQWCLKPSETLTSFENWCQNLQYILALDPNFAIFISDGVTWKKKDKSTPHCGFTDDASTLLEGVRKTAAQKAALLELILGQIANYAGVISRNTIIKKHIIGKYLGNHPCPLSFSMYGCTIPGFCSIEARTRRASHVLC